MRKYKRNIDVASITNDIKIILLISNVIIIFLFFTFTTYGVLGFWGFGVLG